MHISQIFCVLCLILMIFIGWRMKQKLDEKDIHNWRDAEHAAIKAMIEQAKKDIIKAIRSDDDLARYANLADQFLGNKPSNTIESSETKHNNHGFDLNGIAANLILPLLTQPSAVEDSKSTEKVPASKPASQPKMVQNDGPDLGKFAVQLLSGFLAPTDNTEPSTDAQRQKNNDAPKNTVESSESIQQNDGSHRNGIVDAINLLLPLFSQPSAVDNSKSTEKVPESKTASQPKMNQNDGPDWEKLGGKLLSAFLAPTDNTESAADVQQPTDNKADGAKLIDDSSVEEDMDTSEISR